MFTLPCRLAVSDLNLYYHKIRCNSQYVFNFLTKSRKCNCNINNNCTKKTRRHSNVFCFSIGFLSFRAIYTYVITTLKCSPSESAHTTVAELEKIHQSGERDTICVRVVRLSSSSTDYRIDYRLRVDNVLKMHPL